MKSSTRRSRLLPLVALFAVVAALFVPGGISPVGAAEEDDTFRYLALGDSYASGQSLGPYGDGETDRACWRSAARSYPWLVETGATTEVETVVAACGGARVADLVERGQTVGDSTLAPQVELLDDDLDLVTVTIGGNDLEYTRALYFCAFRANCADQVYDDESGATLREWAIDRLRQIGPELTEAYRVIDAESGDARVMVIGYPQLFSERIARFCFEQFFFGRSERVFFAQVAMALDAIIEASALAAGVEYVSVMDEFAGLEACGQRSARYEYMTGLSIGGSSIVDPSSFHPTGRGAAAYADVISARLAAVSAG